MAKDQTRRLSPRTINEDGDALAALKGVENYTPANADFTMVKLDQAKAGMDTAHVARAQAEAALKAARDGAVAAEWAFHNAMLGAKGQVRAQFGDDSDQVQAVGLKKKSEYKSPHRNGKVQSAAVH